MSYDTYSNSQNFVEALYLPLDQQVSILKDNIDNLIRYSFSTDSFYSISLNQDITFLLSYIDFGAINKVNVDATAVYRSYTNRFQDPVLYGPVLVVGSSFTSLSMMHIDSILHFLHRNNTKVGSL